MQTANPTPRHRVSAVAEPGTSDGGSVMPPVSVGKLIYYVMRDRLKEQPFFYRTLWSRRENTLFERQVVRPDSQLVIDGFPRCANTFAYYAFVLAQDRPLRVGNHMHCVSQFVLAQRWKKPALLVIRAPRDAIASNFVYRSELPLSYHLRRYVNFHEAVVQYADSMVVADFPETTSAFGQVVMRLNDRFGTQFTPLQDTPEENKRVLAEVEKTHDWRKNIDPNISKSNRVSFPSMEKNRQKAMVEGMLDEPKHRGLLERAEAAYRALL